MKIKLVLVGADWKNDPRLIKAAGHFNEQSGDFLTALSEICQECIPDFRNWGPSEAYHQSPDYAVPLKSNGLGVTICISQLYQKEGRLIEDLTRKLFGLVLKTLEKFGLTNIHVFAETHVSGERGESFFIEEGPKMI